MHRLKLTSFYTPFVIVPVKLLNFTIPRHLLFLPTLRRCMQSMCLGKAWFYATAHGWLSTRALGLFYYLQMGLDRKLMLWYADKALHLTLLLTLLLAVLLGIRWQGVLYAT